MAVTMKNIAQSLGVSVVTVSKVMRDHADIGPETRHLHDLGYAARIKALEPRAGLDLIEGAQVTGSYQTVGVFFSLRAAASERSIFRGSVE